MKKLVLSVFFTLIFTSAFSQSRWIDMHSLPSLSLSYDRYEDCYFMNASTGWVIHGMGKIYKTTNGGRSFNLTNNTSGIFFRCTGFFDENTGVIGTLEDTISLLRTTNGGVNFSKPVINGTYPKGICGIHILNSNVGFGVGRYTCPPYFIKTSDKGATWNSVALDTSLIRSIVDCYFWSADSGIVVGGYSAINNFNISNSVVLYTTNGGQSFTRVFKSVRSGEWGWKICFINSNTGYVSIETGSAIILKTTNKGLNWTEQISTATSDLEGIGFINENTGWLGNHGTTYGTTNGGANWSAVSWGTVVNRFRFISDTLGYAVGHSIYKFTQESVGVNNITEILPGKIYLHQNFPNPFNPETKINYELRTNGLVTLKIYDVKGNEIATIVNEVQNAGVHLALFDGTSLPSGMYFYKIESEGFSETKKMVLLK